MDLERLRTIRDKERRTDSLQHLRDDFYDEATAYVRQLKRERTKRAEATGDPYTPEAMRLTDEIGSAEETLESLYERRRGKLVERASFAASGTSVETDGMTQQERELFDRLVAQIEENERRVFDAVEVDASLSIDAGRETTATGGSPESATGTPESATGTPESATGTPESGRAASASGGTGVSGPTTPGGTAGTDDAQAAPGTAAGNDESVVLGESDGAPADDVTPDATTAPTGETPVAAAATPDGEAAGTVDTPAATGRESADGAATEADEPGDVLAEAMGAEPSSGGRSDAASGSESTDAVVAESANATGGSDGDRPATEAAAVAGGRRDAATNAGSAETGSVGQSPDDGDRTATASTAPATSGPTTPEAGPDTGGGRGASLGGAATDDTGDDSRSGVGGDASTESVTGGHSTIGNRNPTAGGSATEHGVAGPSVERETVRVTRDVGEVYGVDERSYELRAGDTVSLPSRNVEPLVERDAAERL